MITLSFAVYTECLVLHNITMTKNIIIKINAVIYAVSFSLLIVLLPHFGFHQIIVVSIFVTTSTTGDYSNCNELLQYN